MGIEKFLTNQAKSLGQSMLQSEAKKALKGMLSGFRKRTPESIQAEVDSRLGYSSAHYTVNKDQEPVFKSSTVFFHEWLTSAPELTDRIIKDEESGFVYYDGKPIASSKVALMNLFLRKTGIKNATALSSHFDSALKLLPSGNQTGRIFQDVFRGWDDTRESVINGFLRGTFGDALEDEAHATFLFRKWVIGTAKRVISPGAAFDGCLVMQGPPAGGKTSFFRELMPAPFSERTGEIMGSIKNPQKLVEAIVGKTICCFDELSSLDEKKVHETFKQLLSSQAIDVRLPWRRDAQRFLLRNGFCATTNQDQFIRDAGMSRRLWVVKLSNKGRINFEFLKANRKSLWQEALYLAEKEESHFLSFEEQGRVEEKNREFSV